MRSDPAWFVEQFDFWCLKKGRSSNSGEESFQENSRMACVTSVLEGKNLQIKRVVDGINI